MSRRAYVAGLSTPNLIYLFWGMTLIELDLLSKNELLSLSIIKSNNTKKQIKSDNTPKAK
jgi:hypothetical protein